MSYPKAMEDLIADFMKYPGIGRKTAERYAIFTIDKIAQEDLDGFASDISKIKQDVFPCPVCGQLTDINPCQVCSDPKRDKSVIMIVESPKDAFSFERGGTYNGLYHVLHGVISPMDGTGPEDINLSSLWPRVQEKEIKEIIIATSATQEGEATAMYIQRALKNLDILTTRIGYGVPVGGNLDYADDQTLTKAVENRKAYR